MGLRIDSVAVHGGRALEGDVEAAVAQPLVLSSTFRRGSDGAYLSPHAYSRTGNPNRDALEAAVAALEGVGKDGQAIAFASGSAATLAVLQACARPGDSVVFPDECYFGTAKLAREVAGPSQGILASFDNVCDAEVLASVVRKNSAKLAWVETPSNPTLRITDLAAAARAAHEGGALLVVDNTWPTPLLTRPVELGADLVVHSTSKYFGGHTDLIGGVAVVSAEASGRAGYDVAGRIRMVQGLGGAVPAPFDCWLALRGLQTLAVRVRAQSASAAKLAERLAGHRKVEKVLYPGLAGHPGHEVARRQMMDGRSGEPCYGGMLSILVVGKREEALRVAGATRLLAQATSLGGVESLIEHRASVEGYSTETPENLLRISVGLEDVEDLWEDLDRALLA